MCRDKKEHPFIEGKYTVRANVARLEEVSGRIAPVNMLWNSCVPPKMCFYAWEVWWGKVRVTEHLKKGVSSWSADVRCVERLKRS